MYKDKLDGVISDSDYALFRKSLSDEEQELTARMAELTEQINIRARVSLANRDAEAERTVHTVA